MVTSGGCEAPAVSPALPLARLGWAGWAGWARLGSADAAEGGPGPALAPGPRRDHRRGCLKLKPCTYKLPILYTEGAIVSSAYGQRNIFICYLIFGHECSSPSVAFRTRPP